MSGQLVESEELDEKGKHEKGKHRFRSAMGTLLYFSQDRIDLQHSFKYLSQFMFGPTVAADAAVKHVMLYLKGAANFGVLLGYHLSNKSRLSEIHGIEDPEDRVTDFVEAFTDADWAGDKARRRAKEILSFQQSPGDSLVRNPKEHSS